MAASNSAAPLLATGLAEGERARGKTVLEPFGYSGVRLLPSMFSQQVERTRETYFNLPNDDILKGFRERAGQSAPGKGLDGWCSKTSAVVFGQWLSGMARMSAATGDNALRDKALTLAEGWAKTTPSGKYGFDTYSYEKIVCGLVDLAMYSSYADAWPQLERVTEWASQRFDRSRSPASPTDRDGRKPHGTLEWYTLPENLYRAYLASGNSLYKEFGDVWRYNTYWDEFADSTAPEAAKYLHSYSHANTFNSAAMTYSVTGDSRYLAIIKNSYEYLRRTQCYASGGYGPGEWSVPSNGDLGNALDFRSDSAEIPCGSWGAFKLSKYLLSFTGDAQYGDWIERLLYNGIVAALPVQASGASFYYANYRIGMAQKEYYWEHWPCCSGTYIQTVADYHDVIYFKGDRALYVNLYVPSEVTWNGVTIRQESTFPASDTITFRIAAKQTGRFSLKFRVPSWAAGLSAKVNGQSSPVAAQPNSWAAVERTWSDGDTVVVQLPLNLRKDPVDRQHPQRAAILYGPVLLAQDARYSLPLVMQPDDELSKRLVREGDALVFKPTEIAKHEQKTGAFAPFYSVPQDRPYRVYFDLDQFRFL